MATDLSKLRRSRTIRRNILEKKVISIIDDLIEQPGDEKMRVEITSLLDLLESEAVKIKSSNDEIYDLTKEEDLDKEIDDVMNMDITINKAKEKMKRYLMKINESSDLVLPPSINSNTRPVDNGVYLPKLHIKNFDGNPRKWKPFIESYEAAIHNKDNLSDVEKFTYLRGFLTNNALSTIEGFPLTNENYAIALDLLKKRYGKDKLIISTHMHDLIAVKKVDNNKNISELRCMYDKIEANVRALKSEGINPSHFGALAIPIILEKLPSEIQLHVSRTLGRENWDIEEFLKCINDELTARENCEFLKDRDLENSLPKYTAETLMIDSKEIRCVFCGKNHYNDKCSKVIDVNARLEILKNARLCFNCFRKNHQKKECMKNVKCYTCKGAHNTALCRQKKDEKDKTTLIANNGNYVMLQTATCFVSDTAEKKEIEVRVVLDSCSQQTYITDKLVKKLNLTAMKDVNLSIRPFGKETDDVVFTNEYRICMKPKDKSSNVYINAMSVPIICKPIDSGHTKIALENHPFLKNLDLADKVEANDKEVEIDVLTGADIYWRLVSKTVKNDDESGLVAIKSVFGWLINGPVNSNINDTQTNLVRSHVMLITSESTEDESLNQSINRFFDLDTVGIVENETSVSDEFKDEIKLSNSRYTVKLPLKENHAELPDNYDLCVECLKKLRVKLDADDELKGAYNEVINEQIKAGVIEEIKDDGRVGEVTYLPHRAVVKKDRETTKVRVVLDASAKRGSNVSLNDVLYKGPSLTPELFKLLIKFRIYPIAITSDIEKAYLQINVHADHKDYLRFLYYRNVYDPNSEIIRYRFNRVIFGANCSQFLLNGTVRKHASRYERIDQEFSRKIRADFYVDDFISGVSTEEEGLDLYEKMMIWFKECSFNVVKWRTNHETLRETLNTRETKEGNKIVEGGKILGIPWNDVTDEFVLKVNELSDNLKNVNPTKRNVLSAVASVYDPIGFIQPLVIKLKLLFQEVCSKKIGWDDYIGNDLNQKWNVIIREVAAFNEVKFPRCYFFEQINDPIDSCYLHGFSDSSSLAYAACIYIKSVHRSQNVDVKLVAAKSRLVPLKKEYTIPRLELLGNYILSKLMVVVFESLVEEIKDLKQFCWSDSMITLSWIKAVNLEFKPFVENRLRVIRRNVYPTKWFHCYSEENPSDIITRFNSCNLSTNEKWWRGPLYLKNASLEINLFKDSQNTLMKQKTSAVDDFSPELKECKSYDMLGQTQICKDSDIPIVLNIPRNPRIIESEECSLTQDELKEKKCDKHVLINSVEGHCTIENIIDIKKYSDVNKLCRITALVRRFVFNIKPVNRSVRKLQNFVTRDELDFSWDLWLKTCQRSLVSDVNYNVWKKQLNLFEDDAGFIRTRGRLDNSNLPYDTKLPILLNRDHRSVA